MDDAFFGFLFIAAIILIIGMALGASFKESIINTHIETYGKYIGDEFICEVK